MNHKRKHKRGHSSCGLCKPHKKPGCRKKLNNKTLQERKQIEKEKNESGR